MKTVGERIKEFRNIVKLSRKEFSRIMDVSYSYQMQIELNFKSPSKKYIEKFYKEFPSANIIQIFFD